MATMTKRERVRAALAGGDVDRLPIMFWHHFRPQGSPQKLADATLDFFGRHDLDIYKIMPDIPYPFPRDSIRTSDDWLFLSPLDVLEGNLGRMVTATELTYENLANDEPLIVTMFSPFCYAMNCAGSANIRRHLEENPSRVHEALSVIAHNLASFSQALIAHGADGIFFASQGAGDGILTREQYKEFGVPYDLEVLRGAQDGWLNVLHIHGFDNLMIDLFVDFPASVFSWSDRLSGRSLRDMRALVPGACLMGGIDEKGAITKGPVDQVAGEMRDAIAQTGGGRRLILANGCSVPDDTDDALLAATRRLAEEMRQG
ncbi:MAG TPA: uroporphyrinogen decarboxylase family protein [Chloroflexota bacterium]